ncbi:hypothetical protein [Candidatus Lucifugimonas marina]|uniref:hypothetical protein n=1 Tax=Candidatus Lucifugimonas marina TaxID=3038979 RepID=UPI00319DA4F6
MPVQKSGIAVHDESGCCEMSSEVGSGQVGFTAGVGDVGWPVVLREPQDDITKFTDAVG